MGTTCGRMDLPDSERPTTSSPDPLTQNAIGDFVPPNQGEGMHMYERKDLWHPDGSTARRAETDRNRVTAMSRRHDSKYHLRLLTHKELYPPVVDSYQADFWNLLASSGSANAASASAIGVNWRQFAAEHLEQQSLADLSSIDTTHNYNQPSFASTALAAAAAHGLLSINWHQVGWDTSQQESISPQTSEFASDDNSLQHTKLSTLYPPLADVTPGHYSPVGQQQFFLGDPTQVNLQHGLQHLRRQSVSSPNLPVLHEHDEL